jgi:hypothetical protein
MAGPELAPVQANAKCGASSMSEVDQWASFFRQWSKDSRVTKGDLEGEEVLYLHGANGTLELSSFLTTLKPIIENGSLKPWPIVYCGIVHREHLKR